MNYDGMHILHNPYGIPMSEAKLIYLWNLGVSMHPISPSTWIRRHTVSQFREDYCFCSLLRDEIALGGSVKVKQMCIQWVHVVARSGIIWAIRYQVHVSAYDSWRIIHYSLFVVNMGQLRKHKADCMVSTGS